MPLLVLLQCTNILVYFTALCMFQCEFDISVVLFSERELFAICYRTSVTPSVCRLSVACNDRAPYLAVEIFGNFSTAFGTLAIR